jgi:hypothetical protein
MSAYALAHLREIDPHPDILKYLERIQGVEPDHDSAKMAAELRAANWLPTRSR